MAKLPHSPNPEWKPGTPVQAPEGQLLSFDPKSISAPESYKLMTGLISPRPIAWVSTLSADGRGNLAPFSFFNGVCSNPPSLTLSITLNSKGEKKDTLKNIEATGEFVVNSVQPWLLEAMHATSAEYDYGIDELKVMGLETVPSLRVKPSRVKASLSQLECKVLQLVQIGNGPGSATLVVGEILHFHLHSSIWDGKHINSDAFQPMSRMGGITYGMPPTTFDLSRPKVGLQK